MNYYSKPHSNPFKWLVAIVLFILVMTLTWDEANGIGGKNSPPPRTNNNISDSPGNEPIDPGTGNPVPEPGTIILLGTGLGAAYMMRRRMKTK